MAKMEVNQVSLEYAEEGSGAPLVLVHGSASDMRTWQSQQDAFANHFRAISYSRRYHWPNEQIAAQADYAMSEQIDDLRALILSLKGGPVHIVGHSYGAFLALLLAMREPQLVQSLILAEPPVITLFVSNMPKPLEILKLLITKPRLALSILKFGATGIGPATAAAKNDEIEKATKLFGSAVLGKEFFDAMTEARWQQALANSFTAEFLGSGFMDLNAADIRAVRTPTLLLSGEHSPGLFRRLTDQLQALLPHAERVEIRNASHMMHEDNASEFNAAVTAFLSNI